MLKVKEGKFAGKKIEKVISENDKYIKATLENGMTGTFLKINIEEVTTDIIIENRTYKNVQCADNKERFLVFYPDGEIQYCSNKNGQPWGVGRLIKRGSFLKLPKWSTEEIQNLIKGE